MVHLGLEECEIKSLVRQKRKDEELPHAILIYGPPGVGKSHLSEEIANIIIPHSNMNCAPSSHNPDLFLVNQKESIINVEKVRVIKNWLQMTAIQSRYKVLLIHDIDRMNIHACNAFLKSLEEPTSQTVILLNTSKLPVIPQTIISRCLKLRLRQMNEKSFERLIARHKYDCNDVDLRKVYIFCGGNINIARLLLQNRIYDDDNTNVILKLEKLDIKQQEQCVVFIYVVQKLLVKLGKKMTFKQNEYDSKFLQKITRIEMFIDNIDIVNKNTIKSAILSLLKQCIAS